MFMKAEASMWFEICGVVDPNLKKTSPTPGSRIDAYAWRFAVCWVIIKLLLTDHNYILIYLITAIATLSHDYTTKHHGYVLAKASKYMVLRSNFFERSLFRQCSSKVIAQKPLGMQLLSPVWLRTKIIFFSPQWLIITHATDVSVWNLRLSLSCQQDPPWMSSILQQNQTHRLLCGRLFVSEDTT